MYAPELSRRCVGPCGQLAIGREFTCAPLERQSGVEPPHSKTVRKANAVRKAKRRRGAALPKKSEKANAAGLWSYLPRLRRLSVPISPCKSRHRCPRVDRLLPPPSRQNSREPPAQRANVADRDTTPVSEV